LAPENECYFLVLVCRFGFVVSFKVEIVKKCEKGVTHNYSFSGGVMLSLIFRGDWEACSKSPQMQHQGTNTA